MAKTMYEKYVGSNVNVTLKNGTSLCGIFQKMLWHKFTVYFVMVNDGDVYNASRFFYAEDIQSIELV
jgi:hypothetical protein